MTTSFKNDTATGAVEADGLSVPTFSTIAAAGSNSQANSTLITAQMTVVTTVSGTTRGVRLPVQTGAGPMYYVFNGTATTMNVYPGSNAKIGTAATNAVATLAANKGSIYCAQTATQWRAVGP